MKNRLNAYRYKGYKEKVPLGRLEKWRLKKWVEDTNINNYKETAPMG